MPDSRDRERLEVALAALRRGELVVYPTETLYGLGADAANPAALARLVALKQRSDTKPTSILVASRPMLDQVAERVTPLAARLIARFWPGPLTLVVAARSSVSPLLTAGSGTIGVRWSSHPVATALVKGLGRPLTTPSANPAGAAPPVDTDEARAYFADRVAVYVDGGTVMGGAGSTIVDVTEEEPRVIREGAIATSVLRAALVEAA